MDQAEAVENRSSQETVDTVIATASIIAIVLSLMIKLGRMSFVTEVSIYVLNLIDALTVYLLDLVLQGISDVILSIKAMINFIEVSFKPIMNFFLMLLAIPNYLILNLQDQLMSSIKFIFDKIHDLTISTVNLYAWSISNLIKMFTPLKDYILSTTSIYVSIAFAFFVSLAFLVKLSFPQNTVSVILQNEQYRSYLQS